MTSLCIVMCLTLKALAAITILVGFIALPFLPVVLAADECAQDRNRGPDEEDDRY